eukprot:gene5641-6223_t
MTSTLKKSPSLEGKPDNVLPNSPNDEKGKTKRASYSQTFSNADHYDFLLMFVGTVGALAVGCTMPVTNAILGQMLDALNKNPDSFADKVDILCIAYVIIGVVSMLAGYLQVYCWTATGERQTQRFRERYVNALLSQEIGWFDTIGAGQLNTKVSDIIGEVQDGMGRKIGDLIQNSMQVIADSTPVPEISEPVLEGREENHQLEDGTSKEPSPPPKKPPQQGGQEASTVISKDEKRRLTRRVLALVAQYPGYATVGLLGALFFGALFPCWGYMLSKTQASFYLSDPNEVEDRARLYAFLYIMLSGVAFISSVSMYYGVIAVGEHVAMEMRSTLFESFFHHSIAFFDQPEHSVGTLTAQLSDETRLISKALGESFARQLQAMCTLLVALGLGFSSSWQIAFIVLASFPLTIAAGVVQMSAMRGMQYDYEDDEKTEVSEKEKKKTGPPQKDENAQEKSKKDTSQQYQGISNSTPEGSVMWHSRRFPLISVQSGGNKNAQPLRAAFQKFLETEGFAPFIMCFRDMEEIKKLEEDQMISRTVALIWRYKVIFANAPDSLIMKYLPIAENEILARLQEKMHEKQSRVYRTSPKSTGATNANSGRSVGTLTPHGQSSTPNMKESGNDALSVNSANITGRLISTNLARCSDTYPDILIVDDSLVTLKLTGLTLEKDEHHMERAHNVQFERINNHLSSPYDDLSPISSSDGDFCREDLSQKREEQAEEEAGGGNSNRTNYNMGSKLA